MTRLAPSAAYLMGVGVLLLCLPGRPPAHCESTPSTRPDTAAEPLPPGDGADEAEGDRAWSSGFHRPDLNGIARAVVELDDGSGPSLVVAGDFTRAGGRPARMVARWRNAPLVFIDGFEAGGTSAWSSTVVP